MTRDAASTAQVHAADPARSTWVSANAGSGKTRVLTDRVARMLMAGTDPARILCLTYTKAAAAEMQNRLFRRLGGWAMQPADALRASLADLGVAGAIDDAHLARARRLFAQAIETPGGLRILTIHAFCAALLRRFPLEAGVSPGFAEMEDRAALILRAEIVDDLAEGPAAQAVADLAALYTGEDFAGLAEETAQRRNDFAPPLAPAACRALFGVPDGETEAAIAADVRVDAALLDAVIAALRTGSTADVKAAERLASFDCDAPDVTILEGVFLYGDKAQAPFAAKTGAFPTKPTQARLAHLMPALDALMVRVEAARPRRLALTAARRTTALHAFAAAFLPEYARRKAERGLLDFDDLILRARALLTDPSVAQWVLYRLDGGIDHILVDEAQDTSPAQWQVIEALAAEFTAGSGATGRTLFVVGDRKQSIYSFQGADLATFAAKRDAFGARLAALGTPMAQAGLEHSFRSSPTILRMVDAVFDASPGGGFDGSRHFAFFDGMPGRAELWPPFDRAKDPDPGDWSDPVDLQTEEHHAARLGRAVAGRIAGLLAAGERIPQAGGDPRPVTPGDILILVRRRSGIFSAVIEACKAAGLPIAGADRLRLGGELAVQDIAATLAFLALPEDDLSLAAALRSPLFGLTEGQLYALAQGRPGFLWQALRAAGGHADIRAILDDLRGQADYLRPYDLIERLLTRHGGRARLVARLGAEAEDGIDEMLAQALAFEGQAVPGLTGFLVWLDADKVEVKRQLDQGGGRIRVMTVHGAKGLEAPVVILPDTAKYARPERAEILPSPDGPLWKTPAKASPAQVTAARAARRAADEAESQRLLYVALTRAQSWLIVAAAGDLGKERDPEDEAPSPWFTAIREGIVRAGGITGADGGTALVDPHWPPPTPPAPLATLLHDPLPDWALREAPVRDIPILPLSPSALGGAKALPGEDGLDTAAALARGTRLHRLLEVLPGHPPADWPALAAQLTVEVADGVPDGAGLLAEARAVLTEPALAHLFAPGTLAEVTVTGIWAGRAMLGTIDRLVVAPDRVLAVDYKSNRVLPASPGAVPDGILRQMGAYAHLLTQVFPGRQIDTAILWTRGPTLMPLPHAAVIGALALAAPP